MGQPFFSIVIPTRNRGYELFYTLKTCVEQDFPEKHGLDFEIVVSDNASTDDIAAVVARIASPRVRYVKTDSYLSMTKSWEFAVSQARGDYVGVVGTDDGYLLDTLSNVYEIIQRTGAEAVTFQGAYYYWPSCPDQAMRNTLGIPSFIFPERMEDAAQLVKDALRTLHYGRLPCFLNSFCRREIIDGLRARSGPIFASFQPDVYSGFLIGGSLSTVYVSNRVMLVGGVSGNSTGGNAFKDIRGSVVMEHLNQHQDEKLIPDVPQLPLAAPYIIDSAVKALTAAGWRDVLSLVDFRSVMIYSYQQATNLTSREQRRAAIQAIKDFMRDHPAAAISPARLALKRLRWGLQAAIPLRLMHVLQRCYFRLGLTSGALAYETVDAAQAGISNVYDAAKYVTARLTQKPV